MQAGQERDEVKSETGRDHITQTRGKSVEPRKAVKERVFEVESEFRRAVHGVLSNVREDIEFDEQGVGIWDRAYEAKTGRPVIFYLRSNRSTSLKFKVTGFIHTDGPSAIFAEKTFSTRDVGMGAVAEEAAAWIDGVLEGREELSLRVTDSLSGHIDKGHL